MRKILGYKTCCKMSNRLHHRDGKNERTKKACGVAKGHTVVQRQKGGAWRTTRVLAARSSFVSHSALGSESSGMKRAGTERGSTVSQSRQLVHRGSTNRRFYFATFRAVASRRWPTLSPSLLGPLFLNKETHALLSVNWNEGWLWFSKWRSNKSNS